MSTKLKIYVEINSNQTLVGSIEGQTVISAQFKYDESYISKVNAPISLSLPLSSSEFSPEETRRYFDGLLPEGFTRTSICERAHIDQNDYLLLLALLGKECLGAIKIIDVNSDEGESSVIEPMSYVPMDKHEMLDLAREGVSKSAEIIANSHLSLAGASGKVGLYHDKQNDTWYRPIGAAPSTHIVKTEHVRLHNIVTNEFICTKLANKLGLETPEISIIDGEELLFASSRYDRVFGGSSRTVNGLAVPMRLHQEDFAQALGIPSSQKYENDEGNHLKKCFELIRDCSVNPLEDQKKFSRILIFNILIGNTDNHIKNYGLLRLQNFSEIRLAPAYDLVCTVLYPQTATDMAFKFGDTKNIYKITNASINQAAKEAQISPQIFFESLNEINAKFASSIEDISHDYSMLPGCELVIDGILKHYSIIKTNLSLKQ